MASKPARAVTTALLLALSLSALPETASASCAASRQFVSISDAAPRAIAVDSRWTAALPAP